MTKALKNRPAWPAVFALFPVPLFASVASSASAQVPAEPIPTANASVSGAAGSPSAAPVVAVLAPTPTDDDAKSGEWSWRERELSESSTLSGGSGLLHTQHAQSGATGQFRLSLVGEWLSAGFLCTPQFPCKNPRGGAPIWSDTLDHTGGTLSLGVSLLKTRAGAVDAYGAIATFANSDAANSPALLQVLGDSDLGIKYTAAKGDYLNLGAFAELWLINGTGEVGLSGKGTSAKFGLISTVDLRGQPSSPVHVPARVSLNVVYSLDNTGAVLQDAESASGQPVPRIDRFGLGVNRVDHLDLLLGGEAFLADEHVRPFVEGRVIIPSNRQNYQCHPDNQSGDHCLEVDRLVPATLTMGVRFFPWKRGFSVLAAADISVGPNDFIEELAPVAPWTLFMGAGWAVDTRDRPPPPPPHRAVEVPRVRVVGSVHRRGGAEPIIGAIVTPRDQPDLWPLASGADGKFGADLEPGTYVFDVMAEGYNPGFCAATVSARAPRSVPGVVVSRAAPAEVSIDCPLDAMLRAGSVVGHVRDADTGQPLTGVPVVLTDPDGLQTTTQNTDTEGAFHFDRVAPGVVSAKVETAGYLVQVAPLTVEAHHESAVDVMLRPQPKQSKVVVTAHEIAIKDQIQFALNSAVILPDSYGLLTEIADTIERTPEIKRVEIQGHTDNTGSPEHNKKLSLARAEAVRVWIISHGVQADRLVANGYGQDKPLAPNVTADNRARNRRVQFIILERAETNQPNKASKP